jgi:hypothetical protein
MDEELSFCTRQRNGGGRRVGPGIPKKRPRSVRTISWSDFFTALTTNPRYNREHVATALKAMVKFSEVRARRERVFYKNRMSGNRERQLEADRKLVEENQHLLPMELRDQLQESTLEDSMILDEEMEVDTEEKVEVVLKSAMKGKKSKQTRPVKMKVGGGFEAE